MQLGKATLVEVNDERNAHKNVWQVVLFYFGFSREMPETARLRAGIADSEKQRLELEGKLQASLTENRIAKEELEITNRGKAFLTLGLLCYMIVHPSGFPFLVGLFLLGVVYGNPLLRFVQKLWSYAAKQIPQLTAHLARLAQQVHRGIHDWRWKSTRAPRSFSTSH
jgi:hypothetical protein